MDVVELINIHRVTSMPDTQRKKIDAQEIQLSDFGIDTNKFVSLIVRISDEWSLSIVNLLFISKKDVTKEQFDNSWEIGFLFKDELFVDMFLLQPFMVDICQYNSRDFVVRNLSLEQVNRIITRMMQIFKSLYGEQNENQ
jgi:hypothetical protein